MKHNKSIEANLQAARTAAHEMMRHWHAWKEAHHEQAKTDAIAGYTAAFTSCKIYIENYLKHIHPEEAKMPRQMAHNIQKIVLDMDVIEKMNPKRFEQVFHDIDKLSQKAA